MLGPRWISKWQWATAAAALTLGWQSLTVHVNYNGHWSGLFRTGTTIQVPAALAASTYRDSSPVGYDGEFYRLMAHDPLLGRATVKYLDDLTIRPNRILVPALAWAFALGRQQWIDGAYVLVIAGWIFAGVYWMGALFEIQKRSAAWGMLFLAVPATIVSIDRMTVDVALGALSAGMALYLITKNDAAVWLTLAGAGLVRETGLILPIGCVLAALYRRNLRRAAKWAASAVPALLWIVYAHWATGAFTSGAKNSRGLEAILPSGLLPHLQIGILVQMRHLPKYGLSPHLEFAANILDFLALLSTLSAAILGISRLRQTSCLPLKANLGLYSGLVFVLTNLAYWNSPFGYGRIFAPLFVFLLTGPGENARGLWLPVLLAAFVDLRLSTEIRSQVLHVLHWL